MKKPYFELKKSGKTILGQQYYFVLNASNGETVATSEMYATKQGAKEGIEVVKRAVNAAPTKDLTGEGLIGGIGGGMRI